MGEDEEGLSDRPEKDRLENTGLTIETNPKLLRKIPDNLFWKILDKTGPYIPWTCAVIVAAVFTVATLGGSDLAWTTNFYLVSLLLLLLYIPFIIRRNRQQEMKHETFRIKLYEADRDKIIQMVMEQSRKPEETGKTEAGDTSTDK